MRKEIIYLAHSIHERERGKEYAKELEQYNYQVYNPFYPPTQRDDIKDLDNGVITPWNIKDKGQSKFIVESDLEAVRKCDIFVAIYPDNMTVGIPCEMMYAWMNKIPIYCVVPERLVGHPWIVEMSDGVTTQPNEVLYWLSGDE